MLLVVHKGKLISKSKTEKCKILKELVNGNSCISVAKNCNTAKQILSNWLKKKKQIYESNDFNSSIMKR